MAVFKRFALALLSFILLACLLVFGVALTVNSTALSRHFVTVQVNRLDVSALAEELYGPTAHVAPLSPELAAAIATAASKLETQLKAQFNVATADIYDYLLGRTGTIDLAALAKQTVFSDDFTNAVVDQPAIAALVEQSIADGVTATVSAQDKQVITPYLQKALPSLDSWVRQQMRDIAGPVVDYVLAQTTTLNVVVQLGPMKTTLRAAVHDAFISQPPAQLAGANSAELEAAFNQHWGDYSAQIPTTYTIDAAGLGLETSASIHQDMSDAQDGLTQARRAIGYFRLGYVLLIVFAVLLAAGIIAIHHRVKGAALDLGILVLVCGVLQYIGAIVGGHFARIAIDSPSTNLQGALRSWLPGVLSASLRPLEVFGLVLAGVGIVLIVVAIVYRPRRALP